MLRVRHDRRETDGQLDLEPHAPTLTSVHEDGGHAPDKGQNLLRPQRGAAGSGVVQQGADDAFDPIRLAQDDIQIPAFGMIAGHRPIQDLGATGDHVQRGADLVRDLGREHADRGEFLRLLDLLLQAQTLLGLSDQLVVGGLEVLRHPVELGGQLADLVLTGDRDPLA